jgi:TRAP-type C4-dicarboxylate transport system substrate-binding protein
MDRSTTTKCAGVFVSMALVAASCGNHTHDKAGGNATSKPRVLTMAQPNAILGSQLTGLADEVSRRSAGTLQIEFESSWRIGETKYEAATIDDVKAGKVDMAWVGARVFDTVGVNSLEALVAPMLIDSYDLQRAVFDAGIPEQMLDGLKEIGLVGIGVLPGPMRKMLGVSKPFLRPADFAGAVIGTQDSAVAAQTMMAVGATPLAVPSSAQLAGLDGYEQALPSIAGNKYEAVAGFVTANLNLWPRPLVIIMGSNAFKSLTPDQQTILHEATAAAIPGALADSRTEDTDAARTLCRNGMTLAVASHGDLSDLRAAFQPVYQQLGSHPATKEYLDEIQNLKQKLAAAPEDPECPTTEPANSSSANGFPSGTYDTTVSASDYSEQCITDMNMDKNGIPSKSRQRATFNKGSVQLFGEVNGAMEAGYIGTYEVFRDRVTFTDPGGTFSARWSADANTLTFTEFDGPCGDAVVWGSHPWVRVQ